MATINPVEDMHKLTSMAAQAEPSGDRWMVLLPGLFAGDWVWNHTRRHLLSHGYRIATIPQPIALLDLDPALITNLRSYVNQCFDQEKICRAVVCGNSFGALAAVDYAAHFPTRIEALVVSGAPGLSYGAQSKAITWDGSTRETAHGIADKLFHDRSCLSQEIIESTYLPLAHRKALLNIVRALRVAHEYNLRDVLPILQCPVLAIWGANDLLTPVEEWQHGSSHIMQGRLEILAQCGHYPMIECPQAFNSLLREFLDELRFDHAPMSRSRYVSPIGIETLSCPKPGAR